MCLQKADITYCKEDWKAGPMKGYKVVGRQTKGCYVGLYRTHLQDGAITKYKLGEVVKVDESDDYQVNSDWVEVDGTLEWYDVGFHVYTNKDDAIEEFKRHLRMNSPNTITIIEVEGRQITAIGEQHISRGDMPPVIAETFVCREMKIVKEGLIDGEVIKAQHYW